MTADRFFGWHHDAGGWHPAPDCHADTVGGCTDLLLAWGRTHQIGLADLIVMAAGSTPAGDDSPSHLPALADPGWRYLRRKEIAHA